MVGPPSRKKREKDGAPGHYSASADEVCQNPDGWDGDANFIVHLQGKSVGRNDTGAGQKKAAIREGVVAVEIFHKLDRITLQVLETRDAGKLHFASPKNFQPNLRGAGQWFA